MRRRITTSLLLPGAILLCAGRGSPALAQTLPSLDTRTWKPSTDPQAGLVLEPPSTPGSWQWNVGAWLSYAQSPVVARDASGGVLARPVLHAIGCDLVGGIGLGDRVAVGVDVPVVLWQDGSSGLPATIAGSQAVPTTGLGDMLLHAKVSILDNNRAGVAAGVGLAAIGSASLPTGDPVGFQGEGAATASVRVLAEYAVAVAALRVSLGYAVRPDTRVWPDPSLGGATFGNSLPWAIGLSVRPGPLFPSIDHDSRQTWELAAHGWLPAGPVAPLGVSGRGASALSPALLALDDRITIGHYGDAFVVVGAEIGLDQAVGVPSFRGVLSIGWAPRAHDSDHDGIPDDRDECPDLAEDPDGIQDEDGCPEDDADGDGILDSQDACPLVPGTDSNDPRLKGCPSSAPTDVPPVSSPDPTEKK
jgi:hypothetical protein